MNELWQTAEPYILTIVGAFGGGSIIYLLARVLLGQLIARAATIYDVNSIANKVADKLGGKTIDVDITSLVDSKLRAATNLLSSDVNKVVAETNSYKRLLVLIGAALTHLKMLTAEERAALVAAVNELDNTYVPPEREVVATVKLESIPVHTKPASEDSQNINLG